MSKLPDGPWLDVSMDVCGPLPTGDYLIVIINEFSRFPVVEIKKCLTAEKITIKRYFSLESKLTL